MELTLTGAKNVQQFLHDAPKLIVAHAFVEALGAAAQVVSETLVYNAPEKEDNKPGGILPEPGDLKSLVTSEILIDSQLRGGVAHIGFKGKAAGVVANWVEYGHRIVGHKPLKKDTGKRSTVNPFVRKTADEALPVALEKFNDVMARYVNSMSATGSDVE